jgi:hypothetical protein
MSPARDVSDPSRRSWKGAPATVDPRAGRRARRTAWTIVGALLLGGFGWLLLRSFKPDAEVHAVYIAIGDYDALKAPPLAFADDTAAEFQELQKQRVAVLTHPADIKTGAALGSFLEQDLPRLATRPDQDVLIVYLAAHGVSESKPDGAAEAWLLCSNYDPRTKSGMYRLDDLLAALQACPAHTKLLLLDAGSVETDLALGMVINEFPDLLRAKVAALADPKLWVIASHDTFERSHAAYADRRGAFGCFAARGLAGDADRDANGVDLRELFEYVRDHVARYVWQASAQEATQTPFLIAAGNQSSAATLSLAGQRQLTAFLPRPAPEPAKIEPSPAKSEPQPGKNAVRHLPGLRGGSLALAQAASAPAQPPAAATPAATSEESGARRQERATQPPAVATPATIADTASPKSSPSATGGESPTQADPAKPSSSAAEPDGKQPSQPADAAATPPEKKAAKPRAAPGFEDLLREQWLKVESLGDRKTDRWTPVDFAPHLWLQNLELLKDYELRWERGARSSPLAAQRQLAAAWDDADWSDKRRRFETSVARGRLEQHVDLTTAVRQRNDLCFRLNFYIPWAAGAGDAASNDVAALLETLAEMMRQLRDPPAERSATAEAAGAQEWLAKLRELHEVLQRRVEVLDLRWQDAVKAAIADQLGNPVQIEPLLALPWIAAADRAELIDRLRRSLPLADADEQAPAGDRGPSQSRSRARALQRAEVEWRRLQLAETPPGDETGPAAERHRTPVPSTSSGVAAARQMGAELAKADRGLFEAIVEAPRDGDSQRALRAVEDRLRLVDVRSVQRLDTTLNVDGANPPIDCPFPDLGIAWELKLAAVKPASSSDAARSGEAALAAEAPTTLEWRLAASPPARVRARWSLEYDRAKLQIESPTSGDIELAANRNEMRLPFSVQARTETGESTTLTLRVEVNDQSVEEKLTARLPSLGPIELVVGEPAGLAGLWERFDDRRPAKIVLHPLASGRTNFHLSLRNPARRERKLKYRLLALDRAGVAGPLEESWPLTPRGELSPGFKPLFPAPLPLTIPAEQTIPLPLPAASPPAPAAPAAPDKTPPAPKENPSIADGLICEIIDVSKEPPGAPQWFWIEAVPLHPAKYLAPEVEYDVQNKRLEIVVKAIDRRRLPPQGAKVAWQVEHDPALRQASPSKVKGEVTAEAPDLTLFAVIQPRKDPVEVLLDVDGYPRAFLFDVLCDHPRGRQPRKLLKYWDVQFLEPKETVLWLPDGARVGLKLRVDVPPGWFEQPGRALHVGIRDDERETQRFRGDRRFDLRLLPAEAAGELALDASVGDLQAEIETVAHPNQDLEIIAELEGANRRDQRTIKLDRDPPEIRLRGLRPRAVQGQSLTLELPVRDDRSGVKKVEARIDLDGAAEVKPALAAPSEDDPNVFVASLPVKELPVGSYTALIQATDVVGNKSENMKLPFEIVKAPPMGDAEPAKRGAQFVGKVAWNGRPGLRVTVTVTGPKNTMVMADDATGRFTLADLPPGDYQFTFKGRVKGVDTQFSQAVTIDPPGKKPQEEIFAR